MREQDSPRFPGPNIRWIRWVGTALTSLLFIWLLLQQDWKTMWQTMSSISGWVFILIFCLYFAGILGNAWRWLVLLRAQGVEMGYGETLKIVLSGNFASNFLPSTVGGDSVRIVSAARFAGWSISLASVMVDRLLNMLLMFMLLPVSWITLYATSGLEISLVPCTLVRNRIGSGAILAPVLRFSEKIMGWLRKFYRAFLVWRDHPKALSGSFLISFGSRMMVFTAMWILALNLGMPLTLLQVIGVSTLTYVLSILPISINGLGLREVTMTALFAQLGATIEQASALVMLTRFVLLIETLPGALWVSEMLTDVKKTDGKDESGE